MIPLIQLFLTFFKIGAVSFGGGYAMIPLLTDEVIANGWLTSEEIMNFIAVAESTPGPIAINMATFIGASQCGVLGAFFATLGVVLPSFIIILVIAAAINGLLKFAGVKAFLNGIRPVAVALIIGTALTMIMTIMLSLNQIGDQLSFNWKGVVIFFFVTGVYFSVKKFKKKTLSPIVLILISAVLGIVFFGLIQ